MKKLAIAALGLVGLAVLGVGANALLQGAFLAPGEYDLEAGKYIFNVPGLAPTETPAAPTDMPVPPTDTPVPSGHDDEIWQPLTEAIGHDHGSDPNSVNDIFGEPGCWFGNCGQSISYPFETPNENAVKHEAYTWIVRRDLPKVGQTGVSRDPWIKAFRLQAHFTSGAFGVDGGQASGGYLTRFHSFSLEAQVCRQSDDACGIVRFASHMDTGCLKVQGVQHCLPGEEDAAGENTNLRWRAHSHTFPDGRNPNSNINRVLWYGKTGLANVPPFRRVAMNVESNDSSVLIDLNDISTLHLICPEFDCKFNDSLMRVHRFKFFVDARDYPDLDGDGLVSETGFMNSRGTLEASCSAVGPTCFPYIIQDAPLGRYSYEPSQQLPSGGLGYIEFDTSPPGEFWIRHPN